MSERDFDRAALDTTVQPGGNLDGDADPLLLGEQPAAPEGQLCAVEDG